MKDTEGCLPFRASVVAAMLRALWPIVHAISVAAILSSLEVGVCALRSCAQKMLQPSRTVAHCPTSVAKTFSALEVLVRVCLKARCRQCGRPILMSQRPAMNPACLVGPTNLFRGSFVHPRWAGGGPHTYKRTHA